MSIASQQRSLDEVEIYLSPKEWIIRLTQKMRSYPNETDFWKAVVKESYRECLLTKPFVKLEQQAHAVYPGKRPPDINQRNELCRELQTEFQKWKKFIYWLNRIIEEKAETIMLATAMQRSHLENLLEKDHFYGVASAVASWIRRTAKSHGEAESTLRILRSFTHMPNPAPQIEQLSSELAMLMKKALAHEAAVKLAQDRYFDGHSILYLNIDDLLKQAVEFTTITVEILEEFFSIHERAHVRAIREKPGLIDLERIIKYARIAATLDIFGAYGANLWEDFRIQAENEFKPELEASGGTRDKQ